MSLAVQRPWWSLVAESMQDMARERGLIDPAGRCLPPPFGCGEKPANSYGMCIDCLFELRGCLVDPDGLRPQPVVAGETVNEPESQAVEIGSESLSENHKM